MLLRIPYSLVHESIFGSLTSSIWKWWAQTDSWIRAELLKPPLRYVGTKFSVPINSTSSCMHVPEVSVDGRRRWWQHQSGQGVCEVGRKSECHKCRPVIVVCIWWSGEIPIVKEAVLVMACRNKVEWFSAFSVLATYKQFQGWGELVFHHIDYPQWTVVGISLLA